MPGRLPSLFQLELASGSNATEALQIVEAAGIITGGLQDQVQGLAPDTGHHLPDFPEVCGGVGPNSRPSGEVGGIGLEQQAVQRDASQRPLLLSVETPSQARKPEVGVGERAPPLQHLCLSSCESVKMQPLVAAALRPEKGQTYPVGGLGIGICVLPPDMHDQDLPSYPHGEHAVQKR